MKTSPADTAVVLVGGGAIIAPNQLRGASKVLKPEWSQVANAIGAAIARISAVVDTIRSTETQTVKQLLAEISDEAKAKVIAAGATAESVKIVEVEELPLQVSFMFRYQPRHCTGLLERELIAVPVCSKQDPLRRPSCRRFRPVAN